MRFFSLATAFLALCLLPCLVLAAPRGVDASFFKPGGPLDNGAEIENREADPASRAGNSEKPVVTEAAADLAGSAGKVLFSLAFVTILILGIYRFLRRLPLPLTSEGLVRRLAYEPLGPRQFVQVVEIGGKVVVFACSDKGITKLTELEGEAAERVRHWQVEGRARPAAFRPFSRLLNRLTGGNAAPERSPFGTAMAGIGAARERLEGMGLEQ